MLTLGCFTPSQCATAQQDYLGLFHLFKLFQTWYCFEPDVETKDPFGFRCIPNTNDFSDFTLYFLKKVSATDLRSSNSPRSEVADTLLARRQS